MGSETSELSRRVAPLSLAVERTVPVLASLEPLVGPGLRRGTVVGVRGPTSLALALVAGASASGCWAAAVGREGLGLAAAAEMGVVLERFPLVPSPPAQGRRGWAWVVAVLLEGVDVVVAWPPRGVAPADARRLAGRARRAGSVLVVAGPWPERADLELRAEGPEWLGLGQGHGRLLARRLPVEAGGRGAAGRRRSADLWLPALEEPQRATPQELPGGPGLRSVG